MFRKYPEGAEMENLQNVSLFQSRSNPPCQNHPSQTIKANLQCTNMLVEKLTACALQSQAFVMVQVFTAIMMTNAKNALFATYATMPI